MTTLVMQFGRNQYFARRRGEIILPPEEQQIIRTLLQQIGADPSMDFDNYEELICWDVNSRIESCIGTNKLSSFTGVKLSESNEL